MLAVKVIQEQGIHVEGINFFTGFCVEGHTHAIRKKHQQKEKRNNALWVAEQLGIKLHIIDVVEEYQDILLNPVHGYGKNMNPCLDCKSFMVKKAWQWMQEHEFDFILTGEVIGQRPMSQRRDTMPIISEESGSGDRLVRPLCAQSLPATYPEQQGWLDRDKLLDFSGRTRKPQMALAEQYGFKDYATPAGGCCMLTDESYSKKLVDMWKHRSTRDYQLDDIILLKIGRHLRFCADFKLIIGREEGENNFLMGYKSIFTRIYSSSHSGPLTMVDGEINNETELQQALSLVARYTQGKNEDKVTMVMETPHGEKTSYEVQPMDEKEVLNQWMV
jgi:tRNA-uridine 2-sulfurtransferase